VPAGEEVVERYQVHRTDTPPIIRERDGRFYLIVASGPLIIEAEMGDWFMQQYMEKVMFPRLRAATKAGESRDRALRESARSGQSS
jgi:hypothetical protein